MENKNMPPGVITTQTDDYYSTKIDELVGDMIDDTSEIQHMMSRKYVTVSIKFLDEFIPKFTKLYDLTCDYIENNHSKDTAKDEEIRSTLNKIKYELDGISNFNGHTVSVTRENIISCVELFRKYKKYLHAEGIMNVH
jgi:hypothetical protein